MSLDQEMMTARQVAKIFNMTEKTVRARVPGVRVGRGYRYSRTHIERVMGGGHGPSPVPAAVTPDHRRLAWEAQRLWHVNERQALCDQKTDLLVSSVAAFLIEQPDGDVLSDDFVRYVRRNPPPGGGSIGDALRHDIIRETSLRGLGAYL